MNKYGRLIFLIAAGTLSATTQAEVNLHGFATLAGGITTSDDENLHGYDDTFNFQENSLMGLQVNSDLGEGLSATAQIVARGTDQWNAKFEWAYLSYEANDNIKFLFGRQRIPYYTYSDYLDVSYAYHWITPPEDVYISGGFDSTNGVGAIFTNQLGPFNSTLHFVYGRTTDENDLDGETVHTDMQNQFTTAWNMNWEWLSFRLGYTQADVSVDIAAIEQLAAAWGLAGYPDFTTKISTIDDDNSASYVNAGMTIDRNNLLIVTEYSEYTVEGSPLAGDPSKSYYASVGYRFNNIMPHFTVGVSEATPADYRFLNVVPSGVAPALDALTAGTTAVFESSRTDSEYYILGLRWDFHASAAFKVEYQSKENKLTKHTDNLLRFAIVTVF